MKTKKVKVRATADSGGAVEFDIDGVKAQHAMLKLDKDSGQHAIDFELNDHSGRGLMFQTDDPIWVGENVPCPPEPGVNSGQISVTGCAPETLSTVNANSGKPRELRYQLNFVTADGSKLNCDPIIQNGGGGEA
jgi:hypothetical protein